MEGRQYWSLTYKSLPLNPSEFRKDLEMVMVMLSIEHLTLPNKKADSTLKKVQTNIYFSQGKKMIVNYFSHSGNISQTTWFEAYWYYYVVIHNSVDYHQRCTNHQKCTSVCERGPMSNVLLWLAGSELMNSARKPRLPTELSLLKSTVM